MGDVKEEAKRARLARNRWQTMPKNRRALVIATMRMDACVLDVDNESLRHPYRMSADALARQAAEDLRVGADLLETCHVWIEERSDG